MDPQIKSLLLYQLSYRPSQIPFSKNHKPEMRSTRFERATYGFEVRRSIQLSYERSYDNPAVARVDDGARTRDSQNHNLELYQLSYNHHVSRQSTTINKIDLDKRIKRDLKVFFVS